MEKKQILLERSCPFDPRGGKPACGFEGVGWEPSAILRGEGHPVGIGVWSKPLDLLEWMDKNPVKMPGYLVPAAGLYRQQIANLRQGDARWSRASMTACRPSGRRSSL